MDCLATDIIICLFIISSFYLGLFRKLFLITPQFLSIISGIVPLIWSCARKTNIRGSMIGCWLTLFPAKNSTVSGYALNCHAIRRGFITSTRRREDHLEMGWEVGKTETERRLSGVG